MNKVLVSIILITILLVPLSGASSILTLNRSDIKSDLKESFNILKDDFSHCVFTEYVTTTTCGYCPTASSQLYSIYESGDYDYYYVSLVADINYKIYDRVKELGVTGVPDVFFDGGFKNILGKQDDEQTYKVYS